MTSVVQSVSEQMEDSEHDDNSTLDHKNGSIQGVGDVGSNEKTTDTVEEAGREAVNSEHDANGAQDSGSNNNNKGERKKGCGKAVHRNGGIMK